LGASSTFPVFVLGLDLAFVNAGDGCLRELFLVTGQFVPDGVSYPGNSFPVSLTSWALTGSEHLEPHPVLNTERRPEPEAVQAGEHLVDRRRFFAEAETGPERDTLVHLIPEP
jgi:hypothetical protein